MYTPSSGNAIASCVSYLGVLLNDQLKGDTVDHFRAWRHHVRRNDDRSRNHRTIDLGPIGADLFTVRLQKGNGLGERIDRDIAERRP